LYDTALLDFAAAARLVSCVLRPALQISTAAARLLRSHCTARISLATLSTGLLIVGSQNKKPLTFQQLMATSPGDAQVSFSLLIRRLQRKTHYAVEHHAARNIRREPLMLVRHHVAEILICWMRHRWCAVAGSPTQYVSSLSPSISAIFSLSTHDVRVGARLLLPTHSLFRTTWRKSSRTLPF
jgi:hypothetical protein